jgi:hypothetical protein
MIEFLQVDRYRLRQARDAHNKIAVLKLTFNNTETQRTFETRTALSVLYIRMIISYDAYIEWIVRKVKISLIRYCKLWGINSSEITTSLMEQVREQISYSLEIFKTPE